jgi:hypothetical protein
MQVTAHIVNVSMFILMMVALIMICRRVEMENMTNEELESKYVERTEAIKLMRWDMKQQADSFDYAQVNSLQKECEKIENELVSRGYWMAQNERRYKL